jgi:hypothetical protein
MKTLFLSLLLLNFFVCQGQFKAPKFGKISPTDFIKVYDKDTTADALVLFDDGTTSFVLTTERDFKILFERHVRILLLKKSSFDLAKFEFHLYNNAGKKEKLTEINAATFNLVDGKVVKTKLDKDNLFTEESKNWITRKFAFPDVKEGSIIDLAYSITSDYLYNLRGWNFQYKAPALWSQYTVKIPEYFDYRRTSKGYLSFFTNSQLKSETKYTIHYDSENGIEGRKPSQNYDISANTTEYVLATKDVPAFKSEPNIDCEDNYIQAVEFELASIQFPQQIRKDYTLTWESVNKEMNDDEDFGKLLNSDNFIKDTVAYLCKNATSDFEKASRIYVYVQKRMKWNEKYSLWASNGLKKPFIERSGNSSEINLLLTTMLRVAGLKADPVLFSTRDNGVSTALYPTITKFNSVLTKVNIDDKIYLLDATDDLCPFGVLPEIDVNGQGRVVDNLNGSWVDLDTKVKYFEYKRYNLQMSSEGKFKGVIEGKYDGYAGINYKRRLSKSKNLEEYFRKLQENTNGLNIDGYSVLNRYDNNKALIDTLRVEISDNVEIMGDKILFHPLLFETIEKNRYTLENRSYPVNYNYPISETYLFQYTIPDGYQVESVPQSLQLKLPDNSISVLYSITVNSNVINIVYRRNISKILFLPEEYANLKAMYDQIVKKHAEQIIIKKI